ncbi:unnamed protein product [Protopolystoma xenopodis]|uniref:Uncharacterized protein n=1 Tax=Protopolystoma xenopodis TaxID=117903 RepID=A0A448XDN8_9PLAT|nr:unnamed protein product [Protopolystoma xenopodis]
MHPQEVNNKQTNGYSDSESTKIALILPAFELRSESITKSDCGSDTRGCQNRHHIEGAQTPSIPSKSLENHKQDDVHRQARQERISNPRPEAYLRNLQNSIESGDRTVDKSIEAVEEYNQIESEKSETSIKVSTQSFARALRETEGEGTHNLSFLASKSDLLEAISSGKVEQFLLRRWPMGHAPTNYSRWMGSQQAYEVSHCSVALAF